MDELHFVLYDIQVMIRNGTHMFTPVDQVAAKHLWVDAAGLNAKRRRVIDCSHGIPAWRVMMFHHDLPLVVGDKTWDVKRHTLFVFPPDLPTRYGHADKTWSHSWLRISGSFIESMIHKVNLPVAMPIVFDSKVESDFWVSVIAREMSQGTMPDLPCVTTLIGLWFAKIAKRCDPVQEQQQIPESLRQVHQYIHASYRTHLTLEQLAQRVHMSPRYFCGLFREFYGVSPIRLVTALRIAHACELLADVNASITQIARDCGFGDVYYFSRYFKQQTGVTPTAYRQRK